MDSEQIRTIRNQLAMSQQAFAAALGVSFATVNRWENGKAKPQKDRIDRIKAWRSLRSCLFRLQSRRASHFLPEVMGSEYPPVKSYNEDRQGSKHFHS